MSQKRRIPGPITVPGSSPIEAATTRTSSARILQFPVPHGMEHISGEAAVHFDEACRSFDAVRRLVAAGLGADPDCAEAIAQLVDKGLRHLAAARRITLVEVAS